MKRYLADTSVWIVRRGWFCWRGYTNWSLISRCIVLEEYMKAKEIKGFVFKETDIVR